LQPPHRSRQSRRRCRPRQLVCSEFSSSSPSLSSPSLSLSSPSLCAFPTLRFHSSRLVSAFVGGRPNPKSRAENISEHFSAAAP
jgi:hypothetical protein